MRLGSAINSITPSLEVPLLGYDFRQQKLRPGASAIRDPLFVRALAIDDEQGAGPALLITLDLCILSVSLARHLRSQIVEATGIAGERILISASHTHSGPWLDEAGLREDIAAVLPHVTGDQGRHARQDYTASLPGLVVQAAARACGLLLPVDCWLHQAPLGLGYNRRVLSTDGSLKQCWNPQEYPELRPAPQADPTLSVLVARQRGGSRCWALWCHGCHPVVLGKTSTLISADWPGAANALLASSGIEGHFLLGACGDVHPWLATQERSDAVDLVGHAAGALVALLASSGGAMVTQPTLRIASQTTTIGGRSLDLAAWNVAGMTIAASPSELFAPLANDLRAASSGPCMVATNTNGWTGYWPNRAAFAEGGYEIDAALAMGRQAGDGEILIERLAALMAQVQGAP